MKFRIIMPILGELPGIKELGVVTTDKTYCSVRAAQKALGVLKTSINEKHNLICLKNIVYHIVKEF